MNPDPPGPLVVGLRDRSACRAAMRSTTVPSQPTDLAGSSNERTAVAHVTIYHNPH
jgi:hypothetical protein